MNYSVSEDLSIYLKVNLGVIFQGSQAYCSNPWDAQVHSALRVLGLKLDLQAMDAEELEPLLRKQAQELHQTQWMRKLEASQKVLESEGVQAAGSAPVIELVDRIFEEALNDKATDLHFEPQESTLKVRFRVDGILELVHELPKWLVSALTSRVKIMSNIDISEKRKAQDGQLRWREIDFRVSTLPVQYGEKIVVRVLGQQQMNLHLDTLMMPPWILKSVRKCFHQAQGLFLITGPTGSGKSSSMHAGLQEVVDRPINISTIEDPIEYRLEGANQVALNVKAGFDFPDALRSLLRQDPDVIFVGEIRDAETAKIAIQAAQTGHLVLSTMHTLDAPGAVERLKDLGCDEKSLEEVLMGVLAQRLVRQSLPSNHLEYKGRLGIFEYLDFRTKRLASLREDAMSKMKKGLTSDEEIQRVLGVD